MLYFKRWKIILIAVVSVLGVLFAIPNLTNPQALQTWPGFLPNKQISLGLDLRGGAHILFEVDTQAVVKERLVALTDEIRGSLYGRNDEGRRLGYRGLRATNDEVHVDIISPDDVEDAVKRVRKLSGPVALGQLGGGVQELVVREEGGRITVTLSEAAVKAKQVNALQQSIEIVRRRIDEMGTKEASIQRQGDDRIVVQVPGADDPQEIIDLIGKTAKMSFHDVDESVTMVEAMQGRVPPGSELLPYDDESSFAGEYILVKERALISGEHLVNAQQSLDQQNGEVVVTFRFDSVGARRFADHTRKNIGRPFAIVLDGKVLTAPVIQSAILGGSGQITGNFTIQSANQLAIMLRAGALPAPLKVLEQRTVGAELGADSIKAGQVACALGFAAVIIFMLLCYGLFGLFANLALILNVVLVLGALSGLGATLTLPGIAGIVLTIGMAVDANVLVFERIREELALGKSPLNAVDTGYRQALSTIFDANITTFIAAFILFWLGSGPIRGFAVTLSIGIVTSVFTAFVVTRLMIAVWLRQTKPKAIPI